MKLNDLLNKPTMTVGQLSKKYKVAPSAVETELSKGIKVEMEHTSHPAVAREIALDHLGEDLYYYDKLSKAEKPLAEAVDQFSPVEDPTPSELKLLARRNKYHSARFVIYKPDREGQTHWVAADSEHFTHHSMAPADGAWLLRGYVQYMGDGDYAYRSMEVYSPKTVDHPLLRTWERAGIQNGNPAVVQEALIDNQKGWGNVPNNQNVDYLGLRVQMKPSTFLKLATPLSRSDATSSDAIKQHLANDGAIASPWLIVKIPSAWENHDYSKPALIVGHEGRNRMTALQELEGDSPVEVHLFFSGGMRARHIQPDWTKQLNQRLIPQTQKTPLRGPFFGMSVHEDSTRSTAHGAPGTLKAKITRLYGGDVTCAKTERLKRREHATAHDKAQANWFQNKHCGGASKLDEIFSEPSRQMPWRSYGLGEETFYETNFRFDDKNVVVEMHPDIRQISAKYVFSRQDLDLSPNHRGWVTIFRVDGITDITGEIGNRAAKLLAQVVSVIRGFLQKHDWDYVIFTGEEGSRDRLYQALAQRLASQAGAQVAKYRSDFVVYKSSNLTEAFDYKLEPHSWKVSEQDQDYLIIQFNVEGEPYDLEIVELSSSPGIYDVVFGHRSHIKPIGITGVGNASKVFAAVAQLIDYAIKQQKIRALYFTAHEPSRIKLYKVLSKYFAQKMGWKITTAPQRMPVKSTEAQFLVYKPGFSLTEQGGVGLVVPGVNMPAGIHADEIRRQAKKFGFKTTKHGVPPIAKSDGIV